MRFMREILKALRTTVILWLLTAILYPFTMIGLGQVIFPYQANGSLIKNAQGAVIGSALIGQPFASEKYFWSRPSAISYSTADPGKDKDGKPLDTGGVLGTGVSGASNLAPTNPDLLTRMKGKDDPDPSKQVKGDLKALKEAGIQPTADLLYASGSGLDPHITLESARAQIPRISKARALQPNQVEDLIAKNIDSRFLGIFGEPGVNVLKLNLNLDAVKPTN